MPASFPSVQLYAGSTSLLHHVIVQGICSTSFSTRPNLQMAFKARGHAMQITTKPDTESFAHHVSIIQLQHWQSQGENCLWWGHLSGLRSVSAALHKPSSGCHLDLCKAALHVLWEMWAVQSHGSGYIIWESYKTCTFWPSLNSWNHSVVRWNNKELLLLSTLVCKHRPAVLHIQLWALSNQPESVRGATAELAKSWKIVSYISTTM